MRKVRVEKGIKGKREHSIRRTPTNNITWHKKTASNIF